MLRSMPVLSGKTDTLETVDKDRNIKWLDNHKDIVDDRRSIHYWKVEVPKLVNSGVYSLETMLENKWVYYDDKGQLQVRTIPPSDL